MSKNTINKINKLANLSLMAADEYDKLLHLENVEFITETANLRSFFNVLTNDIVDSISDVMGDDAMEHLKNSNKYLREGIRRLDGAVSDGTPTVDQISSIKDITIKGLVSYILYSIALIGELRGRLNEYPESMEGDNEELYNEAIAELEILKETIDELDLVNKYYQLSFLEEFNIEVVYGDEEGSEELTDEQADKILAWSQGKGEAIDFSKFEEED